MTFVFLVSYNRMRRSAAPSQLLHGNAAKKPRFVPPAPVQTDAVSASSPGQVTTSTSKPAHSNVLNKVMLMSSSVRYNKAPLKTDT